MDDFDWDALATRMDSATTPLGKHLRGSPVVLGVPGGKVRLPRRIRSPLVSPQCLVVMKSFRLFW